MINVSPALQRTFAVALLLLPALAIWQLAIEPGMRYVTSLREELDQEQRLLARLKVVAAREPLARELERRSGTIADTGLFLPGESEPIKAANLQSHISKLAETADIKIRSGRALAAKEKDGLRLLGVQVQLATEIARLQGLLHEIESTTPTLIVEQVQISANPPRGGASQVGLLDVRLDVYGAIVQFGNERQ